MDWHRLSSRLACAAAVLSFPTLLDMLFAITIIHDDLNLLVMGAFLLSFPVAISSMCIAIVSSVQTQKTAIVAIALLPFIVLGIGFLPVTGILRPLIGLDSLRPGGTP